jgi:hypothetical protein
MPIEWGSFSIGTLFGSLVTCLINHFLAGSRDRDRRRLDRFQTSADRFAAAIHTQLKGLYPEPVDWPKDVGEHLRQVNGRLQMAVADFQRVLSDGGAKHFDADWKIYRDHCKKDIPEQCSMANVLYGKGPKIPGAQQLLKHDIDILLTYTQKKA